LSLSLAPTLKQSQFYIHDPFFLLLGLDFTYESKQLSDTCLS
jgi:hypothetical protein